MQSGRPLLFNHDQTSECSVSLIRCQHGAEAVKSLTITGEDVPADWKGTRYEDDDLPFLDQPQYRTMSGNSRCELSLMRWTVGPIAMHKR